MMKSALLPLLAASALLTLAGHARAQSFTTGTFALDGSGVISLGTVQYAFNLDDGDRDTVLSGVTFAGSNPFVTSSPDFTLTNGGGFDNTTNKNGTDALVPGDTLYELQARGIYGTPTLVLNNLTAGQNYAVQLIIGEQVGDNRSQFYTDDTATSPTVFAHAGPQYILDTFTATGSTETLQAHVGGSNGAQLTGFIVEQVPEPSTYAMILLGVAFLGFCSRRRLA